MRKLCKTKRFLLTDLEENGAQCSLDPEADARFAHFIKDFESYKTIQSSIDKGAKISLWKISNKRLRVINGLIKLGLVKAGWAGTDYGGTKQTGVNRVRIYMLSTSVNLVSVQVVRNEMISKIRSPKKKVIDE
jgi:hypothetical protein